MASVKPADPRGWHIHWNNEPERGELINPRVWLHWGPNNVTWTVSFRVGRYNGLALEFMRAGTEEDYAVWINLGWLSLWCSVQRLRRYDAMDRTMFGRTTGIRLHEDHLVVQFECDDSEWVWDGPRHGRQWSCFLLDKLLGAARHSSRDRSAVVETLALPELTYYCDVRLHTDTWKRPRWPFRLVLEKATVRPWVAIPVPGKGENSWDQGDDAVREFTCVARDVAEAIDQLRESIERTRFERGGADWRPAAR